MSEQKNKDIISKFNFLGDNLSITIRDHLAYKDYATYGPEWCFGLTISGDKVTTSGNLHHPQQLESQRIIEYTISSKKMLKIKKAIKKILENE